MKPVVRGPGFWQDEQNPGPPGPPGRDEHAWRTTAQGGRTGGECGSASGDQEARDVHPGCGRRQGDHGGSVRSPGSEPCAVPPASDAVRDPWHPGSGPGPDRPAAQGGSREQRRSGEAPGGERGSEEGTAQRKGSRSDTGGDRGDTPGQGGTTAKKTKQKVPKGRRVLRRKT